MASRALQLAERYFDAWNRRDANAIVAVFAEGGTYTDPATQGPLMGTAIGAYASRLWASFPDLSFEIASLVEADGAIAAEWVMKGTNLGPWNGLPPTGASVTLSGADVIRVEGERIRSVTGYFDSGAVPRALGLDVIVQPRTLGPFEFGVSTGSRAAKRQRRLPSASRG